MSFNQHWLCNYSANVCTDGKSMRIQFNKKKQLAHFLN